MSFLFRPQAVLLDLDGTLVDTLGDFHHALHRAAQGLGLDPAPLTPTWVEGAVGKGSEILVARAADTLGVPTADTARRSLLLQAYHRHYAQVNGQYSRVYDGVTEALEALSRRGLPLACVTNKPTEPARALLALKGLSRHFAHVVGGDAVNDKKPHPALLWRACELLNVPPQQAVMVGDSVNDAQAAQAAACPVVLVSTGYNHGKPVQSVPADLHVHRLDEWTSRLEPAE